MEDLVKVKPRLNPVDYGSVKLSDSVFKIQFDEMLVYFMTIPDDDILYGFRRRAGLPHPGKELGGWYCNDQSFDPYEWNEIFNVFGQWLSFFGRAYKITGDSHVRNKAVHLLEEWGKTIGDDGYFYYSDECNAYHYSYEKIMSGLVDLYVYAGIQEAMKYLGIITDWTEKHLHRFRNPALSTRSTFTGGESSVKNADNEWYTLSEGLYRAFLATGEDRYRSFASVWHYDYYWNGLLRKDPNVLTRVHGYSHVNTLGGAAMAYKVTGEDHYLKTIINAYDIIKEYQWMASGGYAFDEHMATPYGSNYEDVEKIGRSFEVPCGSWAIFKIVRHLISLTGDARYGEWAETALYNAIGGALPMRDDSQRRGKTFYYADYRVGGGRKVYYECSFPCCSGTYPQAVSEYYNLIYYLGGDGVYITQYIPSVLETELNSIPIKIEISGNYPEADTCTITVHTAGDFPLKLRVPAWVVPGEVTVAINGQICTVPVVPNDWITLERSWNRSDKISLCFPMHLRTVGITKNHPERAALMYGPLMLAAEGRHYRIDGNFDKLADVEKTRQGMCFTARDRDGKALVFRPYSTFGYREWYTVYLDFNK
jgi:DUF1680 family protein